MFGLSPHRSDGILKCEIASGGIALPRNGRWHGIHYPFYIKISTGFLAIPDTTPSHCCSLHCIHGNREKPIPSVLTQIIKSLQMSSRL